MIADLQLALKELLYREAGLPREVIDIRFSVPSNTWVAGLTNPTLNFFLYDIRENAALRNMSFDGAFNGTGSKRDLAPRRIDLHFLVTVHFKSQLDELGRDEWNVLWRVMGALLRHREWDAEDLPQEAKAMNLPILGVLGDSTQTTGVFSSVGLSVRPHLHYVMTAPLDLNISQMAPLVLDRQIAFMEAAINEKGELAKAPVSEAEEKRVKDLNEQRKLEGKKPIIAGEIQSRTFSTWQIRDSVGRPLPNAEVRTNAGNAAITDEKGMVNLRVERDQVKTLTIITPDGLELNVNAETPASQVLLGAPETEEWHAVWFEDIEAKASDAPEADEADPPPQQDLPDSADQPESLNQPTRNRRRGLEQEAKAKADQEPPAETKDQPQDQTKAPTEDEPDA